MKHLPLTALLAVLVALLPACQTHEHVVLISVEENTEEASAQTEGRVYTDANEVAGRTRGAASALLSAFSDEQRKVAQISIKVPLRKDWHFVPRKRQGLMLGDMTKGQKTLVHKLMQTALSDSGYLKATDIIWLETVLYEMSNQNPMRDPGKYGLIIFGDPTDELAAWGWRLEGHHLSINLTYTPEGIGVTPLFFGTNPAVVQQGPLAGKRILADEHNLALQLAQSMDSEQRKKMMLKGKPKDIITGPGRESVLKEPMGIHVDDLKEDQYTKLLYLSSAYGQNIAGDHQIELLAKVIDANNLDAILDFNFAWAGPTDGTGPFYYRIQTPVKVIEYSCQGKNHVHCVIHDLTDPLQEDLLKKHFEQHEHEAE